jgi:hypothetical protein
MIQWHWGVEESTTFIRVVVMVDVELGWVSIAR